MRALIILATAVILALAAPLALAGDFDDGMGYDDGFSSPNEDLKGKTNISYVKQKALAQANKAMKEAEELEEQEDLEQQQQIDQAVEQALANQQGNNGVTLEDVQEDPQ